MCELLAISSQIATHTGFSLEKLASHSHYSNNETLSNADGWGVAFYDGNDVTLLREPQAAHKSKLVQFIEQNIPPTQLLISHIRKASNTELSLKNTHPFARELGGRMHTFAHNGDVQSILDDDYFTLNQFQPIGDTDSEYAFCALLEKLQPLWRETQSPSLNDRYHIISEFSSQLRKHGPANFLYADADVLFVHAHKRIQENGRIEPPGLYVLNRQCDGGSKQELAEHGVKFQTTQKVSIIASVPLTNEAWQPLDEGEILIFSNGSRVAL